MRLSNVAAIVAFLLLGSVSTEASAQQKSLRLPYDGNVTAEDLMSGGHDASTIFKALDDIGKEKKSEFETTPAWVIRRKSMEEKFYIENGEKFLFVNSNIYVFQAGIKYNADSGEIRLYIESVQDLIFSPFSKVGTTIFTSNFTDKFSVDKLKISNFPGCYIEYVAKMPPEEARKFKTETPMGVALLLDMNRQDIYPVIAENFGDVMRINGGFIELIRPSGRSLYFYNWRSGEVILFRKSDGYIIKRSKCSGSYKKTY